MLRASSFATAIALGCFSSASAAAFVPGNVYWAPGDCLASTCGLLEVAPGDRSGAAPVATAARSPGQFAFADDVAFLTQFDTDSLVLIDSEGSTSTWATGVDGPTGLVRLSDGRLLVASYYDGTVVDATLGGNLAVAPVLASGFSRPRNLLETSDGRILLADQVRRAVYDISGGGDFSNAEAFAFGFASGPWDLAEGPLGALYATDASGIRELTAGGDVSGVPPFASGRPFAGLAFDAGGRLLASDFDGGNIWDATGGGDLSLAAPWATGLPGFGDTALDATPIPVVPAMEPFERAALGLGLLLASWWLRPRFVRGQGRPQQASRDRLSAG